MLVSLRLAVAPACPMALVRVAQRIVRQTLALKLGRQYRKYSGFLKPVAITRALNGSGLLSDAYGCSGHSSVASEPRRGVTRYCSDRRALARKSPVKGSVE